jgi:hypothetical protein
VGPIHERVARHEGQSPPGGKPLRETYEARNRFDETDRPVVAEYLAALEEANAGNSIPFAAFVVSSLERSIIKLIGNN